MPTFRHRRHNRTRVVPEARAEGFRASPNWAEIAEDAPDAANSGVQAPDSQGTDLNVPDGNVAEVLEWAGDDPDRRAAALYVERQGKGRKTIIKALSD